MYSKHFEVPDAAAIAGTRSSLCGYCQYCQYYGPFSALTLGVGAGKNVTGCIFWEGARERHWPIVAELNRIRRAWDRAGTQWYCCGEGY